MPLKDVFNLLSAILLECFPLAPVKDYPKISTKNTYTLHSNPIYPIICNQTNSLQDSLITDYV